MKKVLLVLGLSLAVVSCDKSETNIYLDGEKETGATVVIAPQTSSSSVSGASSRTPVDREGMFVWIETITVVAQDSESINYGKTFELVDDESGADGFYLEDVPTNEVIDFSASSTSKNDGAGKFLTSTGNPNNLDGFVGRMPFAEYATDAPVSQYVENGDNIVSLQMNTENGRLISSFQLDDDIQYNNPSNNNLPMYKLVVNRGVESAYATGPSGVVAYWNNANSIGGVTQTFDVEIQNYETGVVVYTRTIDETFVASTSTTNKYVVGLDFVDSSTVEVIFTWQTWDNNDGIDETTNCGTINTQTINGNWSLTQDTTLDGVDLVANGGINLNGYTLSVPCGSVTINGDLNGGGALIHCGTLVVSGNTQNNPTITQNCN
jgi:hypothetical protein